MRSKLCRVHFVKQAVRKGKKSVGNAGNAKGNPGNAGNAKGNRGNAGNAEGNPGNAGNAEGNPDNAGSAEGNPKNAGNRSTGQGKIKAGKRSGLRSTSSRSGIAAERENNPKDASCDYRVTVLGLAAGKLQHVMLGKVTPYAKGYAALV